MGSPVDDALDRLARLRVMLVGVLNDAPPSPDWSWEILHAWDAMCEEREQLREERDALEARVSMLHAAKDLLLTDLGAAERALTAKQNQADACLADAEAAEAEVRRLKATLPLTRITELEAINAQLARQVRRLTEGLRDLANEMNCRIEHGVGGVAALHLQYVENKLRALLAGSPSETVSATPRTDSPPESGEDYDYKDDSAEGRWGVKSSHPDGGGAK